MSDTLDLRALGAIIRQMQGEVRALGLKLRRPSPGRMHHDSCSGWRLARIPLLWSGGLRRCS